MSRITTSINTTTGGTKAAREKAAAEARAVAPAAALRRLNLAGRAAGAFEDVIELDASGLASAARAIDADRERVQRSYDRGAQADTALKAIDEKLAEVDTLAATNAKAGTSRDDRRKNQAKIDALLEEIGKTAAGAGVAGARVLDGSITLVAGDRTLELERVTLDTLGKVSANGRALSLQDVRSRGPLDTARRRATAVATARRSIKEATEQVKAIREQIKDFADDALKPRMSDVALAMEGLYENTVGRLGSTAEAMTVARDLRAKMLSSATAAAIVGAEGWDQERLLDLLS